MPAKAGIQTRYRINYEKAWIPACAGMTTETNSTPSRCIQDPRIGAEGCSVNHTTSSANTLSANSSLISSLRSVTPTSSA